MKLFLCLLPLTLVLGCSSVHQGHPGYTDREWQAIERALNGTPLVNTNKPLLTMETRFAGKCPYDGTISLSTSCLPSGGRSVSQMYTNSGGWSYATNILIQDWTITWTCPTDRMMFTDGRQQILDPTKSVQLPLRQE